MVNEATYCSRLFYLEWVQSQFEDSADTVDGRYQHRVVMPAAARPEDADELKASLLAAWVLGEVPDYAPSTTR